ncbi:ABC transporter substrate-binding protein [Devosia sp. CN2-171]|uniref:ABC transporter substrate-binding protein n=1 Tax=Devosia sp. CN2-171 TaxID=3400909 RepID=UPI003BF79CDF
MRKPKYALGGAGLLLSVSILAAQAQTVMPTTPPEAPNFDAQGQVSFVGVKDIYEYKALPEYHEPAYITENFVNKGTLPPVAERLPKEPLVFKTSNMPDGNGVYGDAMRHVIGGRPQTWNFWGGLNYGWGGIDNGMNECLTRTGPLFMVKAEELEPLPNLAKSWEWSEDGHTLTMHIVEGIKWSDGDPFTTEDLMFYWNDHVIDPSVTPTSGQSPESYGAGTTLEAPDDYTLVWKFQETFPKQYLYTMAAFCPPPSHILKPMHPTYNKDMTAEQYASYPPPEYMNFPVLGAFTNVEYRPDDIVIQRRNPYYWKVDEAGNQLPYLNEMHYRLSTWADRDVQTVAGTADLSNLEQPENYVEALKGAALETSPARLEFAARLLGYGLYLNLSANGWGEPDARGQAVRELNRNLDFRKGVTTALDRQRLGESLVKGPFTAIYPGGLFGGTAFYDRASTVYYPFSIEQAKAYFTAAGLADTDGDGFFNWPAGSPAGTGNVEIKLLAVGEYGTDRNLGEGVIAMMEAAGLRVIADFVANAQRDPIRDAGQYDWNVNRFNTAELLTVVQNTAALAPTGPRITYQHRAGTDGTLDLLPFEQEMVDIVAKFNASQDAAERVELMKQYQKLHTENVWLVGLTQYPGALILNKRLANIPPGTPPFHFNWSEDSLMRERIFVPADKQPGYEQYPDSLPGAPGSAGAVTQ